MRKVLDPALLEAIDGLPSTSFEGFVWRVTWVSRDPLAGNEGGGRWSPDNSFETLYTSLEPNGALSEIYFHLSRAPVFSSSRMNLNQLHVSLDHVLRLKKQDLHDLGVEDPLALRADYSTTQPMGAAAHMLDYQGLIVPSARWDCENLVLFMDRISLETQLKVTEYKEINWPAWRESHCE